MSGRGVVIYALGILRDVRHSTSYRFAPAFRPSLLVQSHLQLLNTYSLELRGAKGARSKEQE
jgi:hypothetical protein